MPALLTGTSLALAAFLLFLVEPLLARQLLPAFGGAAAVWVSALLFFQAALLCGYLLADLLARRCRPRTQALGLCCLLLLGLSVQPLSPPPSLLPAAPPALRVLAALALSAGLPFVALSAAGPLLQAWWARTRGAPWRLYALSNAASLLGLFAYPLCLEPLCGLRAQALLWTGGYALLTGLLLVLARRFVAAAGPAALAALERAPAASAAPIAGPLALDRAPAAALAPIAGPLALDRGPAAAVAPLAERSAGAQPAGPSKRPRTWAALLLPACTSALLLSVTAHLTQNVAPVPLLWAAVLAAYLGSFIVAFERSRPLRRALWLPLLVAGLSSLGERANASPPKELLAAVLLELGAFFAVCTAVHAELVRERPPPGEATSFYLRLSLGSALGAPVPSLLAPLLFDTELELPLALFACALSVAALLWREPLAIRGWPPRRPLARTLSLLVLCVLGLQLFFGERRGREGLLWAGRSFYGPLRMARHEASPGLQAQVLFHGTTVHGQALLPPGDPRTPLGYYGEASAAGRAIRALQAAGGSLRVGVLGLGAGVLAGYCRPDDDYTFYELDPLVAQVARERFSFLAGCPGARVVLGDGRLSLGAAQSGTGGARTGDAGAALLRSAELNGASPAAGPFDLLLLDAFTSDAVPVHLLTREALELFLSRLAPRGLLLVHVSNRFLDLAPVLAAHAQALGLHAWHLEQAADFERLVFPNRYVLLSRDPRAGEAAAFRGLDEVRKLEGTAAREWTDDRSNLAGLLLR
jgi:hypothetical protein